MSTPVPSRPSPHTSLDATASDGLGAPRFGADTGRGSLGSVIHALPALLGLTLARGALLIAVLFGTLLTVTTATLLAARVLLG